jgi:hypothetical protein
MKKAISAKQKSVGRPATGITPMMGFRADPVIRASVVRWAENQPDTPSLSEAIRRLVELGLKAKKWGTDTILTTTKAPLSICWVASYVVRQWRSRKALPTLTVWTSFNIDAGGAIGLSVCGYSAEPDERSGWAEGEEMMARAQNAGKPWTAGEDKQLQELEEMVAKLLATAQSLPPGQDHHNALREVARFRARITDLQGQEIQSADRGQKAAKK